MLRQKSRLEIMLWTGCTWVSDNLIPRHENCFDAIHLMYSPHSWMVDACYLDVQCGMESDKIVIKYLSNIKQLKSAFSVSFDDLDWLVLRLILIYVIYTYYQKVTKVIVNV